MNLNNLRELLALVVVISSTLAMANSGLTQSTYPIEVVKLQEDVSGNTIDILITLRNPKPTEKYGKLEAGSASTGYKSLEVTLSPNQKETYQLTGFHMTKPTESFEITLTNQGVGLIEPQYLTVETTVDEGVSEEGTSYWNFVKDNILILAGVVVITVVGIILITPFLYHKKGTKPFQRDLSLEEIKEREK